MLRNTINSSSPMPMSTIIFSTLKINSLLKTFHETGHRRLLRVKLNSSLSITLAEIMMILKIFSTLGLIA